MRVLESSLQKPHAATQFVRRRAQSHVSHSGRSAWPKPWLASLSWSARPLWGSWCPARMSLSCPRCPPLSPWAVAEGVVQGQSRRDFSWRKDRVGFGRTGVHQDLPQGTERAGPSECVFGRRTKVRPEDRCGLSIIGLARFVGRAKGSLRVLPGSRATNCRHLDMSLGGWTTLSAAEYRTGREHPSKSCPS
jgi:hypothetical protein